jgi:hypothetical protein
MLVPQPDDAWLATEYAGYYSRRNAVASGGKRDYFRWLFSRRDPSRFRRVIELGGGEGDCARELRARNSEASLEVVESNPECRSWFEGTDCTLRVETLESAVSSANGAPRDLVILFDVLEHLRDPAAALSAMGANLMAPGGELWATFPNGESLSSRLLGRLWPQYKVEHLFYPSRAGTEALCRRAGLELVSLDVHRKRLSLGYLVSVGAGFGPAPLRALFRLASSILPRAVLQVPIDLPYGEWFLVARKPSAPARNAVTA